MLNIGRIYLNSKKYDSAYYYFTQASAIFKKLNNPVLMADGYTALGNYHFQKGDYAEGRIVAHDALLISQKYGMLHTIFESSNLLHKICLILNDTVGAYRYMVIRTRANDSLYSLQNQKELFRLEFQYNQEKTAKEQKIRQQRSYFIFGFIILGLLSGLFITMLFNSRQKI